jgi:hypothetical protein
MQKKLCILVLLLALLSLSSETNHSATLTYSPDKQKTKKQEHFLVKYGAWQSLSVLGLLGTVSNGFLLNTFYSERKSMATSVNAMICMDTLFRLLYATIGIHWRTYNMLYHQPLFQALWGREQVISGLFRVCSNQSSKIRINL